MDQQLIPFQCQITESCHTRYRSSSSQQQEILIDKMLADVNKSPNSSDGLKVGAKVIPSEALYIQGAEMRLSQYYQMKGQKKTKQSWWMNILKRELPCPMTKLQAIEVKQRALLKDFNNEEQQQSPTYFQKFLQKISQSVDVIEPDSYFYISWQILNSLLVLLFMFEIPLLLFFQIEISSYEWKLTIAMTLLVFVLDIFISLNTAIWFQGILEYDRNKIFRSYIKSCFIQDIVPILCLSAQLLPNKIVFYYVGIFFYLKIYEIVILQEMVYNNLRLKRRSVAIYQLTQLMFCVIFICHLFACFFYGVARVELVNNPNADTWLNEKRIDLMPIAQQYSYAFYWSVTTMISVGYGDITPKNTPEVLITIFTMFVSCILFAYSINSIWEVIRELNENRFKYDKHVTAINRFMYDHDVDRKLVTKINAYIAHMWNADRKRDIEAEQIMIRRLAPALRESLLFDTLGVFLQKTPFFVNNFTQDFLRELSTDIEEVRFSEGEVLFVQEDPQWDDFSLYFIASGSVELYLQKGTISHQISVLSENDSFGWAGFVGGIRRTASAKCRNYSSFYRISRSKFLQRLESYPQDKQIFHQLRDEYLFENKIAKFGINCFICDSNLHLAEKCDKTHFVAKEVEDQEKIINNRKGYNRKIKAKFNAICHSQEVAREAKYMRKYSCLDDDSLRSDDSQVSDEELQNVFRSRNATIDSFVIQDDCKDSWIVGRQTADFPVSNKEYAMKKLNPARREQSQSFQIDDTDQPGKFSFEDKLSQFIEIKNDKKQISNPDINKSRRPSQVAQQQLQLPQVQQRRKSSLRVIGQINPILTPITPKAPMTPVSHQVAQQQLQLPQVQQRRKSSLRVSGQINPIVTPMTPVAHYAETSRIHHQPSLDAQALNSLKNFSQKLDSSDQNLVLKQINILANQLSGGKLDLLNQIRYQLTKQKSMEDNALPRQTDQDVFSEIDSDSAFTIDLQQNFTNYFPQSNPKQVINNLRKNYKKYRRTLRM